MSASKLKMSQGKFMKIWIPIASVLFALCLLANFACISLAPTLDSFFGQGARHVANVEGTENWDLEYYTMKETDSLRSEENAEEVARRVAEEGNILLKNDGVLPLEKNSKITPFGAGYLAPQYSNITTEYNNANQVTPQDALESSFTVVDAAVERMEGAELVTIGPAPGTFDGGVNALSTDVNLYEYDPAIYEGIEGEVQGTVGIVFVTRKLGEGFDQKYDAYTDGTPHSLALSGFEKETIAYAKQHCDSVVVVVNSGNVMELTPLLSGEYEADAILWVGLPGSVGFDALGKLLTGEVNPSGRTADIWAADFTKDPTYPNFGEFEYNNVTFTPQGFEAMTGLVDANMTHKFINYDEGLYYGYRYYETADEVDSSFDYDAAVAFPFGYGLSYSTFEQQIENVEERGDEVSVTVSVKNTSQTDGKEVVQLYYGAPYTDLDREYRIEKPAKNLIAFDKVEVAAGESEEVVLTFSKEDMTSYCYTRTNPDGSKGCYMLEEGEYILTLGKDSHDAWDEVSVEVSETIWYDSENPRRSEIEAQAAYDDEGNMLVGLDGQPYPASDPNGSFVAASNLFEESNEYMAKHTALFTRADWKGTFPAPASRSVAADSALAESLNQMFTFDPETDPELGNVEGSKVYAAGQPASGADNGLSIIDMRGKSYYDGAWEELLDQIDWEADRAQIENLLYKTNYATTELDSLGIPKTVAMDGPNGFRPKNTGKNAAVYPCAPVVAATWNADLIYELGTAYGQEALTAEIDVLYGIGINLHRSPFGGRNGEYYSEDAVLSGKIAAAFVSGAGDQGLVCHIKHFALNDEETNRQFYLHTWADEQTMREAYFRAFEICVKEAKMHVKYIADENGTSATAVRRATTAVMVSQNCIGSVINFASYALNNDLLRGEWGFTGTVITDMYTFMFETEQCNKTWLKDYSIRAGSDLYLTWANAQMGSDYGAEDYDSATARSVIRKSLHNWAYTLANSSVMNGVAPGAVFYYDMSPWMVWLIAADVVCGVFVAAVVVWIVVRGVNAKKHPEQYKSKGKDKPKA